MFSNQRQRLPNTQPIQDQVTFGTSNRDRSRETAQEREAEKQTLAAQRRETRARVAEQKRVERQKQASNQPTEDAESPLADAPVTTFEGGSRKKRRGTRQTAASSTVVENHRITAHTNDPELLERNTKELQALLRVLPSATSTAIYQELTPEQQQGLIEVYIELGRPVRVKISGEAEEIVFDKMGIVGKEELEEVKKHFDVEAFNETSKNRCGIEETLHRVSAIKNRKEEITGFTVRRGQELDFQLEKLNVVLRSGKNILILGKPGVGKTSLLRSISKALSIRDNTQEPPIPSRRVVIVDRSMEIAGGDDIIHPSVGNASRLQVPYNRRPGQVMIEALENHNPDVVIADEIGKKEEVDAALTIAERGVQLIATAHGYNLQNLIENPEINPLIGGVKSVTTGDKFAKAQMRATQEETMQKERLQQIKASSFDYILVFEDRGQIAVYDDIDRVVRNMLQNGPNYTPEPTTRINLNPSE